MVSTAAKAIVKSTSTSAPDSFKAFSKSSEPTIGTPIGPIPACSPASFPAKGVFGISIAATTSMSSCSVIFLIIPEPILPAAPVTATFNIISSLIKFCILKSQIVKIKNNLQVFSKLKQYLWSESYKISIKDMQTLFPIIT